MTRLLLIIGVILVVLWLLGFFAFNVSSPVIHALIVIGVILIILDLVRSRRTWWWSADRMGTLRFYVLLSTRCHWNFHQAFWLTSFPRLWAWEINPVLFAFIFPWGNKNNQVVHGWRWPLSCPHPDRPLSKWYTRDRSVPPAREFQRQHLNEKEAAPFETASSTPN